jgi:hypothetical protein
MSTLLKALISAAILGDYERLHQKIKTEEEIDGEALPYAHTGLIILSGNSLEIEGHRILSRYEIGLTRKIFRASSKIVAHKLLAANPQLVEEVLNHPFLESNLKIGPLKRLTRTEQAAKALRLLISDAQPCIDFQEKGLFDWDTGDVQGAMAITYGWRKVVTKKRGIFQSPSLIHRQGHQLLRTALATHPENQLLQLIEHQHHLAWASAGRIRRANTFTALEALSQTTGDGDLAESIRLLALLSLLAAGLRFRDVDRSRSALTQLQQRLVPNQPDHPHISLMRAWVELQGGDLLEAHQLALHIREAANPTLQSNAAQILHKVNDLDAARATVNQTTAEFLPRTDLRLLLSRPE